MKGFISAAFDIHKALDCNTTNAEHAAAIGPDPYRSGLAPDQRVENELEDHPPQLDVQVKRPAMLAPTGEA